MNFLCCRLSFAWSTNYIKITNMCSKKTVFNKLWLDSKLHPEFNPWLAEIYGSPFDAFCKTCQTKISLSNMRRKSLVSIAGSSKHMLVLFVTRRSVGWHHFCIVQMTVRLPSWRHHLTWQWRQPLIKTQRVLIVWRPTLKMLVILRSQWISSRSQVTSLHHQMSVPQEGHSASLVIHKMIK